MYLAFDGSIEDASEHPSEHPSLRSIYKNKNLIIFGNIYPLNLDNGFLNPLLDKGCREGLP